MGKQIVVTPEGLIGPCQAFMKDKKFFNGRITSKVSLQVPCFTEWFKRHPFYRKECSECAGLGLCGGGCGYNAYMNYSSIIERDKAACTHVKELLKWMVWDLYEQKSKI